VKRTIPIMLVLVAALAAAFVVRASATHHATSSPSPARPSPDSASAAATSPTPPPGTLFDQEFNGPAGAPPDSSAWMYDTGYGWDNGTTRQTYTSAPANAAQDGQGDLVITALADPSAQGGHTSARLQSRGTPFHQGTAIIVRAKLDAYQAGAWPAVWTLGQPEDQWPKIGEVDVFEDWYANNSFTPKYRVHTANSTDADTEYTGVDPTQWHVYEARWVGSSMLFSVDGKQVGSLPYNATAASSVLLNIAVGGLGGTPATPWHPFRLFVDYLRIVPA
jgi:beta-glucanase (GH16 family)